MVQKITTLRVSADLNPAGYEAGARRKVEADRQMVDSGKQVAVTVNATERQVVAAAGGWVRHAAAVDKSFKAQMDFDRAQRSFNRALESGKITVEQHAAWMDRLRQKYGQAGAAANENAGFMRRYGAAAQAVGYQVGDFAVQVASGQNALVALTQQSAQLLGAFGPLGAVLGAVAAVSGGLAAAFMRSDDAMGDATKQAERHTRAMEDADRMYDVAKASVSELAGRYRDLGAAMREVEKIDLTRSLRTYQQEWSKVRDDFLLGWKDDKGNVVAGFETRLAEMGSRGMFGAITDELRDMQAALSASNTGNPLAQLVVGLQEVRAASEGAIHPKARAELDALIEQAVAAATKMQSVDEKIVEVSKAFAVAEGSYREAGGSVAGYTALMTEMATAQERARHQLDQRLKQIEDLRRAGATEAQIADLTARAYAEYEAAITKGTKARAKATASEGEFASVLAEVNQALDKYQGAAKSTVERMDLENEVLRLLIEGREEEAAWLQEEARLRQQLLPLYDQHAEELRTLWMEQRRLNDQLRSQREAARAAERAMEEYGRQIATPAEEFPPEVVNDPAIAGMVQEAIR